MRRRSALGRSVNFRAFAKTGPYFSYQQLSARIAREYDVTALADDDAPYSRAMFATAIVKGKVVRFRLSTALALAHERNSGTTMTEPEAVAFVETKRRARALRSAKLYLASRP